MQDKNKNKRKLRNINQVISRATLNSKFYWPRLVKSKKTRFIMNVLFWQLCLMQHTLTRSHSFKTPNSSLWWLNSHTLKINTFSRAQHKTSSPKLTAVALRSPSLISHRYQLDHCPCRQLDRVMTMTMMPSPAALFFSRFFYFFSRSRTLQHT